MTTKIKNFRELCAHVVAHPGAEYRDAFGCDIRVSADGRTEFRRYGQGWLACSIGGSNFPMTVVHPRDVWAEPRVGDVVESPDDLAAMTVDAVTDKGVMIVACNWLGSYSRDVWATFGPAHRWRVISRAEEGVNRE